MTGDIIWAAVRVLIALPVVLGLACLVLKYGLARRQFLTSGERRMKLVEQLPLGPKATLSIVSLGGRYYLFAHQDSSINLVKELENLPESGELKVGDIIELAPRTIGEFDQLRKLEAAGEESVSAVSATNNLKQLLRHAGRMQESFRNHFMVKKGSGGKGGKTL